MFLRINKTTELETYIANVFSLYRKDILSLHYKEWKEENISGKSCIQYKVYQYYLAIYYVILIYLELKQGINTDWNYYIKKYNLDKISKCLACDNIDLESILKIFGLSITTCIDGIECIGVEESFEVEPVLIGYIPTYNKVIIKDLLNNLISCELLLLSSKCNEINNTNYILQITNNPDFLIL